MSMGILFNLLNGYMQGEWIFYLSPEGMYHSGWFTSAWFIAGSLLFFAGMLMNWHSDYIIRHLRKPGDTRHYLPQKGMYRYVTSANYLGEIIEWAGWAILTWFTVRDLYSSGGQWPISSPVPMQSGIATVKNLARK